MKNLRKLLPSAILVLFMIGSVQTYAAYDPNTTRSNRTNPIFVSGDDAGAQQVRTAIDDAVRQANADAKRMAREMGEKAETGHISVSVNMSVELRSISGAELKAKDYRATKTTKTMMCP